mgnify:CR=1 FL=1
MMTDTTGRAESVYQTDSEAVEELLNNSHPDRVFNVEDDIVWVSGLNERCRFIANDMARSLSDAGIPTSLVFDDDAYRNGGVCFRYGTNA